MTLDLEPRDRSRLLAVAILLAVFMAGIFGGATLFFLFQPDGRHVVERREHIVAGPGMMDGHVPGDREGVVFMKTPGPGLFGEELELNDEQRERVERLMEDQREKAEQLMADMEPRMKALVDSTNAAIEEVLTPEQREQFRELQAERRDLIVRRFRVPVPPPPPGE